MPPLARRPALEAAAGVALAALATSLLVRAADEGQGGAPGGPTRLVSPPLAAASAAASAAPPGPLGEGYERDEAMAAGPELVHQTRLTARLDPATHKVHGEGEIRWKNVASVPVNEAYFHLYLNAFKHARTAFLRSRLGEGRGEHPPATWGDIALTRLTVRPSSEPAAQARDLLPSLAAHSPGDTDDQTDLRAPLPSPCEPGAELTFELAFDATLPSIVERTGYLGGFHMVAQWFPKMARLKRDGTFSHFPFLRLSEFDADFGSYDVTLEVPRGVVVGATGEQVEEGEAGGLRRLRYVQQGVHDFAWTAWDGFQERRAVIEGVSVRALYPQGHEPAVDKQLDGVAVAMRCMNRRLGKYPYKTLTVVQTPPGADEAGGMEYPTLITTGGPWHGPPFLRTAEAVAVHEYGHQYFYGLLASDEHKNPFLDEGVNSFVQGLCLREGYGPGGLLAAPGLTIDYDAGARWMALSAGHDLAIAHASGDFPTASHYGRLVYARTAVLLSTLRRAFGEEPFDRALGRYARAYRFKHPEPAHLLAAFREVDGAMGDALEEGLLRRGWVDAAVVGFGPGAPGWAVVARRGTLKVPVEVALRFADGSERRERWDGQGEWLRLDVEGDLVSVEVDPERRLMLDEDWSNNARSRRPARLAPAVLDRGAFYGAVVGLGVAP